MRGDDLRQLLLRQGEEHSERLQLRDNDKASRIASTDDVALVDLAKASASINRRADDSVVEDRLGAGNGGIVGFELRFELGNLRTLSINGLLSNDAGRDAVVARQVALGVVELRRGQLALRRGLIASSAEGGIVDLDEHIALLDLLTFLEGDLDDFAFDLRFDSNGVERARSADAIERNGHIGELGGFGQHRGWQAALSRSTLGGAGLLATTSFRLLHRRLGRGVINCADREGGDEEGGSSFQQHAHVGVSLGHEARCTGSQCNVT